MVGLLFVIAGIVSHQIEGMTVKRYGEKYGKGGMFFNAFLCFFAVIYFFISDIGDLNFLSEKLWIFGIVNSFMYAAGFYSMYIALKEGSYGLTRLVTSFTGIVSILYGILFLGDSDKANWLTYVSIAMIFASLFLMQYQKRSEGEKGSFSVKWLVSVIVTFASNAVIGILGKEQQLQFTDEVTNTNAFKNEYLIITFLGSALWLFLLGFIYERSSFKATVKTGLFYGAVAGVCNGVSNLFNMISYEYFILSVVTPLKTALGMIFTFLIAIIFYKEKFSLRQYIAVVWGCVAVVLMSI